jgi:predicted TIM-barrel fold metal-dependent hydrolase
MAELSQGDGLWDGPIIDAHQHFWEPAVNYHPWLEPDARIPFRYGDYSAIKRRYLPDDYKLDAAGEAIIQTVYVETEWDPTDPIGETRYASDLAARYGWPNAIVAQAWLDRDDVAEVLAAHAGFGLARSIRHKPGGPASPREVGSCKTLMSDTAWREGFALLAKHGLSFDLQTPWWNLDEAVVLARDFRNTTIILNHAGLPAQRDAESLAKWHAAMARLAECPNCVVKLSGLGVPGESWRAGRNGWIVNTAIDLFGAERAMFGSNFPVDSLCNELTEIIAGFKSVLAARPRADQRAFFCDTARRTYRIAPLLPS